MVDTLQIGNIYTLSFKPQWTSFKGNYRVVGITLPDTIEDIEEGYKLYSTYFTDLGLGLTSYTEYISNDTIVYICNRVTNILNGEFEYDSERTFIPSTLLDFSDSNKLVEVHSYRFVIDNIRRVFDNESEKEIYENNILNSLKDSVHSNIKFIDKESQMFYTPIKDYITEEEAKSIRTEYKKEYSDLLSRNSEAIRSRDTQISDLRRSLAYLNSKSTTVTRILKNYKDLCLCIYCGVSETITGKKWENYSLETGLYGIFKKIDQGVKANPAGYTITKDEWNRENADPSTGLKGWRNVLQNISMTTGIFDYLPEQIKIIEDLEEKCKVMTASSKWLMETYTDGSGSIPADCPRWIPDENGNFNYNYNREILKPKDIYDLFDPQEYVVSRVID